MTSRSAMPHYASMHESVFYVFPNRGILFLICASKTAVKLCCSCSCCSASHMCLKQCSCALLLLIFAPQQSSLAIFLLLYSRNNVLMLYCIAPHTCQQQYSSTVLLLICAIINAVMLYCFFANNTVRVLYGYSYVSATL